MPITRSHVWTVVTLTLVLLVGANLSAWLYLRTHPVNPGVSRVWQKWQMLERLDAPVDWVVIGDSACGAGIRPDTIQATLGGTAINLCTVANASVVNQAWQIARYVERFGPPRGGIIVLNAFHTWGRTADDLVGMLNQIPLPWGFWRKYAPRLSAAQEVRHYLSPLTALYHQNVSVRYLINHALSQSKYPSPLQGLSGIVQMKGQVPETIPNPDKVSKQTQDAVRAFSDHTFEFSAQGLEALRAIQLLSVSTGTRIYIGNTSIARALISDRHFSRYFESMNEAVSGVIAGSPNIKLILRAPPAFGNHEMDNIDHVVGDDAVTRFSNAVAQAVLPLVGE